VFFNLEVWGRDPFLEESRVDILCTGLYYICFIRVLSGDHWVIVSCYNGSQYKKVENHCTSITETRKTLTIAQFVMTWVLANMSLVLRTGNRPHVTVATFSGFPNQWTTAG